MQQVKPPRFYMYLGFLLAVIGLSVTLSMPDPARAYAPPGAGQALAICQSFQQTKSDFEAMARLRAEQPHAFSDDVYKAAAYNYINQADACYHATAALQSTADYTTSVYIDNGPLIPPDYPPAPDITPQFTTKNGYKWGGGSPFIGGQDIPGPGIPGGTVTYSFMPAGVYHYNGPENTPVSNLNGFQPCFYDEIANAFAAWSAVADIQFINVAEIGFTNGNEVASGSNIIGNVRIGAYPIDGSYGILAQAYYPPYTGVETSSTLAGDIQLDASETWACNPDDGIDIGIIATHEIGHTIGFSHQSADRLAIMNPYYNPGGAPTLLQDDINGAQTVYTANSSPGLMVTQPPLSTVILPGGIINYTIVAQNFGSSDITGATITNLLPANAIYVTNSASNGGTFNNGAVVWPNQTVPAGSQVTRTFQARVANSAGPGDVVVNTVSANPAQQPGGHYTIQGVVEAATCGFSDNFEASQLGPYWTTYTTNNGRIRVANNSNFTHSGSRSIWLDTNTDLGAINSHAAIILNADLTDRAGVKFDFWWRNDGDELHADDGVFLSDDNGASWTKVFALNRDYLGSYHHTTIDIDAEAAAHDLSLNHQFKIKIQGYDNYAFNGDGYAIDDVALTCDPLTPNLSISQTVSTAQALIEPGDAITYTIVVANNGNGLAQDVRVFDDLPAHVNGANLDETVTIKASKKVTYTLQATLGSGAPFNSVITNTAYFTHSSGVGQASAPVTTAIDTSPPQFLTNDPLTGSPLITPTLGITIYTDYPNFKWHPATDNDRVSHYTVVLTSGLAIQAGPTYYVIAEPRFDVAAASLPYGDYMWSVQAYDPAGNVSQPVPPQAFTLADPADAPPPDGATNPPDDGSSNQAESPLIYFPIIMVSD
ncbi:MAG: matrixin family metalloprotease [Anaerolineales bacterium]|nr:matrixin family metalloprotease [Anaerolineales bacterium]